MTDDPPQFPLDVEAATYAELTGVFFGWTQEAPQRVVFACKWCKFSVEEPGTAPGGAPPDWEDQVTARVWAAGVQMAHERRCPHLASYEIYRREARVGVGLIALLRQAPKREP